MGIIGIYTVRYTASLYIQVSDIVSDENTFSREVSPLLQIRDAYPKMLLVRTRRPEYQYEGIRIVDIADWLLK